MFNPVGRTRALSRNKKVAQRTSLYWGRGHHGDVIGWMEFRRMWCDRRAQREEFVAIGKGLSVPPETWNLLVMKI